MKKRLFCFLTAIIVFIFAFPSSFNIVSAAENGFEFPSEWFSSSVNADQYRNYFEMLKKNLEFKSTYSDKYTVMFFEPVQNQIDVYIIEPNNFYTYHNPYTGEIYDFYTGKFSSNTVYPSALDDYSFETHSEIAPIDNTEQLQNCSGLKTSSSGNFSYFRGSSYYYRDSLSIGTSRNAVAVFSGTNFVPYDPIISPLYEAVYSLSIEKEEFIKWLIDNEKYVEIADSLVENRVSGFVDIFQRYGANNKAFVFNAKNFFDFIGIGQTVSDYGSVLEKTRSLYREYQKSVRQQLIDHYNNKVKDTLNIKPVTNDNNTTLITDADNDTVVVRLLRDILRSLISLPVNIGNLIRSLEVKVDGLDNSVIIANDGGSTDLSVLWTYNNNDFDDDLINFSFDIAGVQQLPVTYLTNINENSLMPEKMLNDKDNLTVNIPNMSGFTVSDDGKSFSTQTTSYVISSNDYPWLDPLVKKIKRFSGILLILGYLVSLRYRLPEIVRGE